MVTMDRVGASQGVMPGDLDLDLDDDYGSKKAGG